MWTPRRTRWCLGASALLLPFLAHANWETNMTRGVTDISQSVFNLHMIIFWICVAIGVVVFGVMFWSVLHHRKSKGAKPAQFHESTMVEVLWTIIPFAILVAMAVPATSTLIKMYDTRDAAVDIKITGYQWKWQYEYLNEDISFVSNMSTNQDAIYNRDVKSEHYLLEVDEPMVIPTGTKVRFLVTSNDVIHSWWVPALAVKRDAIPGFINEAWTQTDEPGIYRGQCAELCGKDHGFMPVVVHALPPEEYAAWVKEKQEAAAREAELTGKEWTLAELSSRGEQIYNTNCAGCHQINGQGLPPTFPSMVGTPVVTGPVVDHAMVLINGRPGTAMASFKDLLSPVDIAAVITYQRNAWGNNMGDLITPKQIQTLIEGGTIEPSGKVAAVEIPAQ